MIYSLIFTIFFNVLGSTVRAISKILDNISDADVEELNIPTSKILKIKFFILT
jgi:bisphosphoglycerate-dependent phosphoglycerate mutase